MSPQRFNCAIETAARPKREEWRKGKCNERVREITNMPVSDASWKQMRPQLHYGVRPANHAIHAKNNNGSVGSNLGN